MGYSGFPRPCVDPMKPLVLLFPLLLLGACASPRPAEPGPDELAPDFGQPGEAGYHLLMAEIALQRDLPEIAATEYLRAAKASEDPEIAAQATRVASAFGTREEGLEAAARWVELAPELPDPRRFLVRLHLQAPDVASAAAELEFLRGALAERERPFLELLPLVADARDRLAALEAMAAVAERYPQDASGAYAMGYLALRGGDAPGAEAAASRALELEPDWTDAAVLLARAVAADDRPEEALALLEARPAAEQPELRLERAVLLMAAERNAEARAVLEEILAGEPGDADALRALGYLEYFEGDHQAARQTFMSLLATGEYTDDALFYLGGIAEQEGEIEEAARLYARVSGGEQLVTAQVRLALVMFRMGRPELAIDHLELFARRNPEAAVELHGARAELLMRMDRVEEALAVYDEILARHPGETDARYARALIYEELDRVEEALADFEHIVAQHPDDPIALNALGYTLTDRADRHAEAYALIRRALDLDPENPAILDSMGWVLFKLGRAEDGLPYVERSWALQRDPEIAAHLGEILWSLGRIDEARTIWTEAIVEFPGSEILLGTMGRLDP
jgi:tetratricopeptide (TPR) repeat protein